jgi:hypothetical protein
MAAVNAKTTDVVEASLRPCQVHHGNVAKRWFLHYYLHQTSVGPRDHGMKPFPQDNKTQRDFWSDESGWPVDTRSHLFLARAVDGVGKTLFGDGWTGKEPTTEIYRPLPYLPPSTGSDAYFAHELLRVSHPDLKRAPLRFGPGSLPIVRFTGQEWTMARALVKTNHDEHAPALARFRQTTATMAAWAAEGKLLTALRPTAGGDFTALAPLAWNTEQLDPRFTLCQMSPRDPFSPGFAGDGFGWIYIERESLLSCLAAPASTTASAETNAPESIETEADPDGFDRIPSEELRAPKQEVARKALWKKYPSGLVGKDLSLAQISEGLPRYLKQVGSSLSVSVETIARVLGRK